MTDRDASALQCQLDAMRMARAEDHRSCARLTARVKELERWERDARSWFERNLASPYRDEVIRILDRNAACAIATLAEGTRDETAARCDCRCGCRVPVASAQRICLKCEMEP